MIQFNIPPYIGKEDEYIKVDEETKDFTMVNDDIYEVKPKRKFKLKKK